LAGARLSAAFSFHRLLEGAPSFAEKLAFCFSASQQGVGDNHSPIFTGLFFFRQEYMQMLSCIVRKCGSTLWGRRDFMSHPLRLSTSSRKGGPNLSRKGWGTRRYGEGRKKRKAWATGPRLYGEGQKGGQAFAT
jgi:hypothetical protein